LSLTWHIVLKDLYRLRWILVLWGTLMVGCILFAAIQAGLDTDTYYPYYLGALICASGLLPLIAFSLVMGLIHDDPVAESDAFWITRPISAGRLLGAKSVALFLLWLIPVIVSMPVWIHQGYDLKQLQDAAKQTLKIEAAISFLALPIAALSPNGSRFVMNVMLASAGLFTLALVYRLGGLGQESPLSAGLAQARYGIVAGIWVVASLAIAGTQFFGGRTRRSLVILSISVVLGFAAARWWPWAYRPKEGTGNAAAGQGASLGYDIAADIPCKTGGKSIEKGATLQVRDIFVDGLKGELVISLSEAEPNISVDWFKAFYGALPEGDDPAYYFLVDRSDGRSLLGQVTKVGEILDVSTIRYSHRSVIFAPARGWNGTPARNFSAWLEHARLVKVVAHDAGSLRPAIPPRLDLAVTAALAAQQSISRHP